MKPKNISNERDQINKILQSYNQDTLKQTLFLANYCKSQFPNLENIPVFHNIIGLVNLRLKDWKQSIKNFEKAIKLNSNSPRKKKPSPLPMRRAGRISSIPPKSSASSRETMRRISFIRARKVKSLLFF